MTRTLLTAIFLALFSHATWANVSSSVLHDLNEKSNVSRIEFSLLKIQFELQKAFDEDHQTLEMTPKVEVKPAYNIDQNLIGLLVSAGCNRERDVLLAHSEMADILARETLLFFSNFGNPQRKNIEGNNILNLNLGKKFSKYAFWAGAEKVDFEKMTALGQQLAEIFIVQVDINCKGKGSSFSYNLNSNYSSDFPYFDEQIRKLIYEY